MSWHFSQALEAEFSEENSLGGEPYVQSKSTTIAAVSSCNGSMAHLSHPSALLATVSCHISATLSAFSRFRVHSCTEPLERLRIALSGLGGVKSRTLRF